MKVGYLGLGRMGAGISRRLVDAGFDVVVYDVVAERTVELVKAGASAAKSVAEACRGRQVVISMLPDDAVLNAVALGEGGIRDSLPAGAIHVAMGTHGVAAIRALAAAHAAAAQRLVAAPVLGRPDLAATGQLGIVSGGDADSVAACQPLFAVIGRRSFNAGATPDSAVVVKLLNNFLLGCAIETMGEAFSMARKYEVALEVFYEVLTDGLFASPAYKVYGRLIADQAYDKVGFATHLGLKDINLVLAAGEAAQVPLPSASQLRDRLLSAVAQGDGDKDWSVVAREQARASGLK